MPWPPSESHLDALDQWIKDYYANTWHCRLRQGEGRSRACGTSPTYSSPSPLTTRCSKMVVTAKADWSPGRTVDSQALNKVSNRETHHTPSPRQPSQQGAQGNVQDNVGLLERVSFHAISSWETPVFEGTSGDTYIKRMDDITAVVHNKIKIVNDTMLYEGSMEEYFFATCRYVDLCARKGVVFNPSKLRFGRKVVDCAGFTVTDNWFSADQEDVGGDCKFSQAGELDWSQGMFWPCEPSDL